jgi:hypothetical protein
MTSGQYLPFRNVEANNRSNLGSWKPNRLISSCEKPKPSFAWHHVRLISTALYVEIECVGCIVCRQDGTEIPRIFAHAKYTCSRTNTLLTFHLCGPSSAKFCRESSNDVDPTYVRKHSKAYMSGLSLPTLRPFLASNLKQRLKSLASKNSSMFPFFFLVLNTLVTIFCSG